MQIHTFAEENISSPKTEMIMNNKVLLATLAGGVVSYLLGWLIFGMALAENTSMWGSATGIQKTEMGDMWALILGNLTGAYLLAHIFSRWAGINTLEGGLKTGAFLGFLIWLTVDLIMFGTTNMYSLTGVGIDVAASTVMGAATGGIIGWVLGYKQK